LQIYANMSERMGLAEVEDHARRVEALSYDGICVPDAVDDGLLLAQAVLRATERLKVCTSVLVCFPRSPMIVAVAAWDLQSYSGGRFELGLGTQVRGNITGRYSTPWTPPVARMREYILSLRAIFDTFQNGTPLEFKGDQYQFTRMQPFFNPGPIEHPNLPILMGAVGPKMTELVGEVSDGMMTHPTNTAPRFLREVTAPAIAAGAKKTGRDAASLELMAGPLVATGSTPENVAAERERHREMLTFLYSTPAYWRTLDLFGWGDVGRRLHQLTREGRWADMAGAITDEILDAVVPSGTYETIGATLRDWFGDGPATRILFPVPPDAADDDAAADAIRLLREDGAT
jgi:probable F420-dependent oxidoreductase